MLFRSHELYQLAAVVNRLLVHAAAVQAGVGKGVQTDMGDDAGLLVSQGGEQVPVHAQRHGVARDFVLADCATDGGGHSQMCGNQGGDNALVIDGGQPVAILLQIARRNAGYNREVLGGVFFSR